MSNPYPIPSTLSTARTDVQSNVSSALSARTVAQNQQQFIVTMDQITDPNLRAWLMGIINLYAAEWGIAP